MKKQNDSASERSFPLLVWDSDPTAKISLKTFFSKCTEHRIEVQPLTSLLSTLSANGVVALANLASLEPKLFSIPKHISTEPFGSMKDVSLEEIQAAISHVSNANSIIAEALKLSREAGSGRS